MSKNSPLTRRDFLRGVLPPRPFRPLCRAVSLRPPPTRRPVKPSASASSAAAAWSASVIGEAADVKGIRIVATCDCQVQKAQHHAKLLSGGKKWGAYADFRQMIEQEKLDAVMIETTTHARSWIAMIAMQMGMDAYIEKPMALTISEGRTMVRAARNFNRVTQVGTQQRSMPINNWASDLVKNGALGRIVSVLAPNFIGPIRWTKTSTKDVKKPVDHWWDVWTNQAELRPLAAELIHGWGTWWDYDGGGNCFGVTGWGAHSYDQVNRALGTDDTGPVSLLLEEPVADRPSGKFAPRTTVGGAVLGDTGDIDTGTDYHHMAKLTGPRAKTTLTFANGTALATAPRRRPRAWLGRDLHWRERQDRDQPQQARQQPQGNRSQQGQPRSQPPQRNRIPHRELDPVHQEPQGLQRRH